MSSPSTPRSTRSASSAGGSPNILTPGRKIKAMMAAFDSDSESDNQATKPARAISKSDPQENNAETQERSPAQALDSDSDDAEDIVRPKGRMAARMQGQTSDMHEAGSKQEDSAFARLSKALRTEREQRQKTQKKDPTPNDDSSDDDLPAAGPRRRNNANAKESPAPDNQSNGTPPRPREFSPLFLSSPTGPSNDTQAQNENTGSKTEEHPKSNARFLALVAQKRKEREEREKLEAEKKAASRSQMEQFSSEILSGEESGDDDPGSARKLMQKPRQPRKASKKALEEMSRETQRMSRNMQLAHQATTRKKITKESLFARFNFMQPEPPAVQQPTANSSSTAGSQNSSDGEGRKHNDTPHTSPVLGPSDAEKPATVSDNPTGQSMDGKSMPKEAEVSKESEAQLAQSATANPKKESRPLSQPPVRVLLSRHSVAQHQNEDSDSDFEVVTSPAKCRSIAAFENLPAKKMQESPSMTKLKALAHLTSPTRKMTSMNSAELSASLLFKARRQAAQERRERIEELRAKGVHIETAEERAAMEDDVENLVEKARQEAEEIARQEKAAKKKGQDDDEEEDDDDYRLSGSDEDGDADGDDEDEDEDDEEGANHNENLLEEEEEAHEDDSSADEQSEGVPSDVEGEVPAARRKRPTRVVSDDEDEEEQQPPSTPVRPANNTAQSAERPQIRGLGTPGNMSMGLTQAFAGTLGDNFADSQPGSATVPFSLPDPGHPVPSLRKEDSEVLVRDSQEQPDEPDFMAGFSQNITRVSESPAPLDFSQYSQLPDPTQDEGFVFSPFDPAKRFRETPPLSTVDTVLVGQSQSPIADRKSRHLRRGRAVELSKIQEEHQECDFEIDANAFNVMNASKKPAVAFNKKSSKAKDIVEEAAEESEDEYAGLGGASDDSDGEENAYDQQMINDNSGEVVDEKQLAALNAVQERNRDEKDVAKLLKDITTGALRRRKGADDDLDLDDSDDERLARRREKQREFAKMRKALLADDKIGEIAENPKKVAFFKAVEDRDFEDDFNLDFLDEKESGSQGESSQDVASEEQTDSGANANGSNKRKRPLEPSAEDTTNRPPPHLRRTPASAMSKKPATLAEIRATLSFLTETPEYDSFHEDASLDDDATEAEDPVEEDADAARAEEIQQDGSNPQTHDGFSKPSHPRRTRGHVVDRLALLRQASSNSATASGSGNTKFAFHSGGSKEGPIGFRPPQLLRRVTTGSSSSSGTSTSSTSNRVSKPASGPKKGGAVNSYTAAREKERERELRLKQRSGGSNFAKLLSKHAGSGLNALASKGQWD